MSKLDKTNVNSDKIKKKKKKIIKDKKKLLEIYAIVSGLIIASIQDTGSLIADINMSANERLYNESLVHTREVIEASNSVFFMFIFLLLIYYTKTFDEDRPFTWFLVISISASFSYILTSFIKLHSDLSFWGLFISIFLAIVLTLFQNSILIIEKEKRSKIRNNIYALEIRSLRTSLLKSFVWGVTVYLIFCLWGAYNPLDNKLIYLWTISAMVLSILLEHLR